MFLRLGNWGDMKHRDELKLKCPLPLKKYTTLLKSFGAPVDGINFLLFLQQNPFNPYFLSFRILLGERSYFEICFSTDLKNQSIV